jgi:hypothetical protein
MGTEDQVYIPKGGVNIGAKHLIMREYVTHMCGECSVRYILD